MKLNYITLKNFRQYCGKQTIHFATDEDRHVTVINGVNGAGKTSVCIALNWCLYDENFVKEKFGEIGELVSKHPLVNIEGAETSVKIGFTYQGQEYWAERKYVRQGRTPFLLKREGGNQPYQNQDAEERIQLMIPKEVSVHFFFDGEKIDNFALPGREDDVKDAVCNVLKIEVVQRSLTHLKTVAGKYDRDLKEALEKQPSNELQVLLNEKRNQEIERQKLEVKITEKREEIAIAKSQILDIDEKLKANETSRKDAENRNKTEGKLEQFRQDQSDIQNRIQELANRGFIPMAKLAVDKALEILNQDEIESVPESLLRELLEQMQCLCGRPIQHKSQAEQHLCSLLKKAGSSKLNAAARETYSDLQYLSRVQLKEIPADLRLALSDNQRLDRGIAVQTTLLKEISEKLKDFNQANVRKLQNDRDQCLLCIGKSNTEINLNQDKIGKINKKVEELTTKIKKAKTSTNKTKQLKRYWELAEDALGAMTKIHELFAESMREKVEPIVEKIFKKLVWKSSTFQSVCLTKEFELQVIDSFGEQARPELSAGERQVLSLAFIVAMAQIAAEEMPFNMENEPFPIVMDTPFGRLAEEPRKNITKTIPEIADQLILFVTDTELGGEARNNLKPRIGKEYSLQFDQETSITTINPII